ncbi:MAG: hypothetical protein PVJ34_16835 [Anaerolineae bacterium]|jgi:hypothetical protein
MPTLEEIANRAQNVLADSAAATWSQATVQEWITDAIKEYSTTFPRQLGTTVSTSADTHNYTLPSDFLEMLLVEYPTGEDPPEYLERLNRKDPRFWHSDDFYDVEHKRDAQADGVLWISDDPAGTETVTLTYLGHHDLTLAADDSITVPAEHEHLLILWVVWRAHQEREADELQNPDTTIRMLHQMKLATEAAERAYYKALNEAKEQRSDGGWTVPWKIDTHDRIY